MSVLSVVGQRVPMLEGVDRVTGTAVYTSDIGLPGMLHGAVFRSPHPHARIVSIDTSRAARIPGVQAVVTAADTPRIRYVHLGAKYSDRYPLAVDRVRFVGEEVAAVAATTPEAARQALEQIAVRWEPLDPVFTPEAAMAAGAPPIHDGSLTTAGRNIAQHFAADYGAVDEAFSQAAAVFEDDYAHGAVAPVCMETNGTVASFDLSTGELTLWTATQAPFFVRKEVAHVLGLPRERVHIKPVHVGGGFGGKSKACEQEAIAALLAMKTGRPVRLVLSRHEEFASGKTDHAKAIRLRTAVAADGRILGRSASVVVDNGAYTAFGPVYVAAARQRTACLYRVDSAHYDARLVYTNKVPGGQYRGMGAPQMIWAIESQLDRIAAHLGRDPLEYRVALANRPGDVTPLGWKITSCALAECLEEVGRRIGWAGKRRHPRPNCGIGVAAMIHPSGGVYYEEGNYANVALEVEPDGRVLVATMTADTGTWQNTMLAQLVAETLEMPVDQITVLHMDTSRAPEDLGSAASRVTFVTGNAAVRAARALADEAVRHTAKQWERAPDDVEFAGGRLRERGGGRGATLGQVAAWAGGLRAEGYYQVPTRRPDPATGYGNYAAAYVFGAQAAEVEIDPATGKVHVLRVVAAQDVGRAINPTAIEGQIHGGILQGIGMALQEALVSDRGVPVNGSILQYKVPRATDAPAIELALLPSDEREGPYGAKAAGEPSINATVAAIANAVTHATGITFRELPLTPDRVLAALAERDGRRLALKPYLRPRNVEVAAIRRLYPSLVFPVLRKVTAALPAPPRQSDQAVVVARRLGQALGALAAHGPRAKVLAGGTDVLVGIRQGIYAPEVLIDVTRVDELRRLGVGEDLCILGAGVTLAEVASAPAIARAHPSLVEGIQRLATPQVRNVATVGGDLCQQKRCWFFRSALPCYKLRGVSAPCYAVVGDNRHHAIQGAGRCAAPCPADLAPILVALDARAHVASVRGERRLPMEAFYRWSGEPDLSPAELLVAVEIPHAASPATEAFEKFTQREGDFAEASVAVRIWWQGRRPADVRIAVGAVSPFPARAERAERAVLASDLSAGALRRAAETVVHGSLPLSANAWKTHLLVNLTERALCRAVEGR